MDQHVNAISGRLSLRPPQRTSLEILSRVCEIVPLKKDGDVKAALEAIRAEFSTVEDFEREFPSLCFALATGVGKTRLMGAFISYLYSAKGIRHFFVLAPNLTIYNKLIADFTPNTPKYVFQGISEFAITPPEIVTGDNYESGRGIRSELGKQQRFGFAAPDSIHVNIFNISKINAEVRGDRAPRIKRLSEYIGESYFDYLSKLEDLVLIMDESHRYRATAGINAINELNPIIGLELTATPQVEKGNRTEPFKNVIFSYPLSTAMQDGFVKEPAVATRENFDASKFDDAGLERLKLEDGIRIHEKTKIELDIYSRQNGKPIVKPFMLVVARDVDHAGALVKSIEDDKFFDGKYKGRVITVHSKQSGEEKDDVVEQLMTVEHPDNPTEIVIHVNMLKEGWDVTNLYTIVPLRAANSKTLVEQSIGRGLRLPYGRRTGVASVDRLTIVSHDKFQEIVDYANSPDSVIRGGLKVVYITDERTKLVVAQPEVDQRINAAVGGQGKAQQSLFKTDREREVARATMEVIRRDYGRLPTPSALLQTKIQKEIVERVKEMVVAPQGELDKVGDKVEIEKIVAKTTMLRNELSIDIPRITVQPVGEVTRQYKDFDLDLSRVRLEPVESAILIQELHRREQARLDGGVGRAEEEHLENYIIRGLIDYDDICYDDHSDLLYKFATQVIAHLRSYLKSDEKVQNVLLFHQREIVDLIHLQMQDHFEECATEYEAYVCGGITALPPAPFPYSADEKERDFRTPVKEKQDIRKMIFGGFDKCLYPVQKFDSDSERRFAVILENDKAVVKWFKPGRGVFKIHCRADKEYEPDFVVESRGAKYLCEPKMASEMKDPEVLEKAAAAVSWCKNATEHELKHGGKPWHYLLIPHDKIADNMTLEGLASMFEVK